MFYAVARDGDLEGENIIPYYDMSCCDVPCLFHDLVQ